MGRTGGASARNELCEGRRINARALPVLTQFGRDRGALLYQHSHHVVTVARGTLGDCRLCGSKAKPSTGQRAGCEPIGRAAERRCDPSRDCHGRLAQAPGQSLFGSRRLGEHRLVCRLIRRRVRYVGVRHPHPPLGRRQHESRNQHRHAECHITDDDADRLQYEQRAKC